MAMVKNPITGEWEDDGLPESPVTGNAPPVIENPNTGVDLPPAANPSGGATLGTEGNPMVATIARTPKPPIEIVDKRQTVTPSDQETEAQARLNVANKLVHQAENNVTGDLQEEARIKQKVADAKLASLEDQKLKNWELDQQDKREDEAMRTHAKTLADDRARKQIAAGRAKADYFKGNFVGQIVAALVQSVAAGLHARAGKDGLSPAERIFETAYANHEKGLLAEYEASKQAAEDFKNDRAKWEAEKAARRAKAAQDALHDVNIAMAVADRSLAKLEPSKIANAQQQKQALEQRANARFDLEFSKGLRGVRDYEKTSRPGGDGSAAGGTGVVGKLTESQASMAGALSDMADALKEFDGVKISQDELKKIQDNADEMTAAQVKPGDSALKPLGNKVMRGLGMSARNKFEGVSDKSQKAYLARERSIDQLNKTITGAASTDAEVARRYQQWIIQPGDSDDIVRSKTNAFKDFIKNRVPLTGGAAPLVNSRVKDAIQKDKPVEKKAWPEGERRRFGTKIYQMKNGKPIEVPTQ